ncbi:MAG TPA: putative glycoside hydrolase [Frankiaceae bacterium]|nr:putative glycoside hydrolase [Frankiaceae bacterium]
MTRWTPRLTLGAVAASVLVALAPGAQAQAATGTVNPPALWYKIAGEITDAEATVAASRYRVVILQSWQTRAASIIKSLNPAVTVLAYKDLSSASYAEAALDNERNGRPMATGVGYIDATANGWLAKDTLGNDVGWKGYPNLWQTEVWNPAYQQRWVDNVTKEINGSVWDGVFGDDALTTLKYYSTATLAEAPTDADLQAGEEALIKKASDALHALGKKLVVNISGATDNLAVWTRWSQMTDGAMLEHYAHWGTDPNSPSNYLWDWGSRGWTAGVQALATSPGNVAVTTSADTDDRSYRYGLASFLIANAGHGAFTAVDSYKKAPWRPEQAWNLGYATAPMVKVGAAYTRVFPAGFAAVNPLKDQTVTVPLPAPLQDVTGATVSSVTLPPLTGAVFKGTVDAPVVPPVTDTTTTTPTKNKGKWRHYAPTPVAAPTAGTTTEPAPATAPVTPATPVRTAPGAATAATHVPTAARQGTRAAATTARTAPVTRSAAQAATVATAPAATTTRRATTTTTGTALRTAAGPLAAMTTAATSAPTSTDAPLAAVALLLVAGTAAVRRRVA